MTLVRFYRKDLSSSPITTSKKIDAILLKTCKAIKTANQKDLNNVSIDQSSKIDDNKNFFQENPKSKDENKSNKEDWLDKNLNDTNINFFYIFIFLFGMEYF